MCGHKRDAALGKGTPQPLERDKKSPFFNLGTERLRGMQQEKVHRFGKLAIYDTVIRLGVYLHAGTNEGARALGLDTRRGILEPKELPTPFRSLEPWECEDFLCIYKDELAKLKRKL